MRDAGLEVVHETGNRTWIVAFVIGNDPFSQLPGDLARRRLVGGLDTGLELGPDLLRHLGRQVAHPMRQATLAGRAREAGLQRLDDPRRAIGDHQQGIAQSARAHVLEECADRLVVFLAARHQVQQNLLALDREAPGRQHRLAPVAGTKPLGDPVDEQIGDLVLRQVPRRKVLVVLPQPRAHLRDRRAREQKTAAFIPEGILDVTHRKTPRQHLDRQILQTFAMTLEVRAKLRAERFGRPRHLRCGVIDPTLRRLQMALARAVAVAAARRRAVFVIVSAQGVAHLAFQAFFDDQARRQANQLALRVRHPGPAVHQCIQGFTHPLASLYSRPHGGASCLGPAQASPGFRFDTSKDAPPAKFPASLGLHPRAA